MGFVNGPGPDTLGKPSYTALGRPCRSVVVVIISKEGEVRRCRDETRLNESSEEKHACLDLPD